MERCRRTQRQTGGAGETVVLGAGLAGLSAAYVLSRAGRSVTVIERDVSVGGLARTLEHNGYRFDIGGHRFKTDNPDIERLVRRLLGDELLRVRRSSKILLRGKYFDYPLRPLNAFFGFGAGTASRIILDYAMEQIKRMRDTNPPVSLEDWVTRHFGRTLYNIYFKTYSEKVWGIDCRRISMEWMAQRIQGLSLGMAIKNALFKNADAGLRTLADTFLYPRRGIGCIADRLNSEIQRDNAVWTNTRIERIRHAGDRLEGVTVCRGGKLQYYAAEQFISSIPLAVLVQLLHPPAPGEVMDAARRLEYRDLVIVSIMIDRPRVTDQTWIYLPESDIPFGRLHEPTNWSAGMAPAGRTLLVAEYFCFRGDSVWDADDPALAERTISWLEALGFVSRREVVDHFVLRVPRAYPLFELGYRENCQTIRRYLARFRNLHLAGRGGLFKYYNMDHAMASGMETAETVIAAGARAVSERAPLRPTGTFS